MADAGQRREIDEAIQAGEYALQCLEDAADSLKSASGWGLLDIFGGGLISGMAKHARMGEAQDSINEAKRALSRFAKEASDVEARGLRVDCGNLLTFADFFFDGAVADVLVQQRIEDARGQVERATAQVEDALRQLRAMR